MGTYIGISRIHPIDRTITQAYESKRFVSGRALLGLMVDDDLRSTTKAEEAEFMERRFRIIGTVSTMRLYRNRSSRRCVYGGRMAVRDSE